jgi:hypothetical protein
VANTAHENSASGGEVSVPLASQRKQSTEMPAGRMRDGRSAADVRLGGVEDNAFVLLVVAVSLAFAWIPDYMVLISTLVGIAAFGVHGFIIGPLIAAMFIAVWDIFSASRQASPVCEGS